MADITNEVVSLDDIQADQDVYGSDGSRIGRVEGITVNVETGESYLEVAVGLFKMLYVPKHKIKYAVMGQPVRLKVSRDEALEQFIGKPPVL